MQGSNARSILGRKLFPWRSLRGCTADAQLHLLHLVRPMSTSVQANGDWPGHVGRAHLLRSASEPAVSSFMLSTKSEARNSTRENMFPPVCEMQNIYIINSLVQRTVFTFKRLTKFIIKSNIQNFFWFSLFVTSWCQSSHNWKRVSILVFLHIWALW
jgi:hypothetical protein